MKIKADKLSMSPLNQFDLLGYDETALSKAFAYVMGKEKDVLFAFLRRVGIRTHNTTGNFLQTSIEIEKYREEGRTDIEIRLKGKFHVIIESKIRSNRISKQRTQYLSSFNVDGQEKNVLCFITDINDYLAIDPKKIKVFNFSWIEISNFLDTKKFRKSSLVFDFLSYLKKGYIMREQKEVLIQDLGDGKEITRFKKYHVYRRDVVYGNPLYFAPYFTNNAGQAEGSGISYLSKVLGILTLKPMEISNYTEELNKFTDNKDLVDLWLKGLKNDKEDEAHTYFFLEQPLRLTASLKKDGGTGKGRGVGWIAGFIPKNRCVTFEEFTKRLMQEMSSKANKA